MGALKRKLATASNPVGVRLQQLKFHEQALVLARIAQGRSEDGLFRKKELEFLFDEHCLPKPANASDVFKKLRAEKLLTGGRYTNTWTLTPLGRQASVGLLPDIDIAVLAAELTNSSSTLAHVIHTVVPPTLAPPGLIGKLRDFLAEHPFERNVFGMTRFPDEGENEGNLDPVKPALEVARKVCALHGLEFHLASDRALDDDLWANVAAHMWASQYGIAFFENRRNRGLNYNLTIEVGSMLMTGRRCALLKDTSIDRMPTDLVGKIYKSIDLSQPDTVEDALHEWARKDLSLGKCALCRS